MSAYIISIERDILGKIDIEDLITKFANSKCRQNHSRLFFRRKLGFIVLKSLIVLFSITMIIID